MTSPKDTGVDLGDLVIVLLSGALAGLRDHLAGEGFERAAELVADLVDMADEYAAQIGTRASGGAGSR